jgi:hypothetical protein
MTQQRWPAYWNEILTKALAEVAHYHTRSERSEMIAYALDRKELNKLCEIIGDDIHRMFKTNVRPTLYYEHQDNGTSAWIKIYQPKETECLMGKIPVFFEIDLPVVGPPGMSTDMEIVYYEQGWDLTKKFPVNVQIYPRPQIDIGDDVSPILPRAYEKLMDEFETGMIGADNGAKGIGQSVAQNNGNVRDDPKALRALQDKLRSTARVAATFRQVLRAHGRF